MKDLIILEVKNRMADTILPEQMAVLEKVLDEVFWSKDIVDSEEKPAAKETPKEESERLMEAFLEAKRIEGCSARTLQFYRSTIGTFLSGQRRSVRLATTEGIRSYSKRIKNIAYIMKSCYSQIG